MAENQGGEYFSEHLRLSPLPHHRLLAHFNFTTRVPLTQDDGSYGHHYHIFPRAIGDIVQEYQADELHFTLGRGQWDHQRWGYPPVESVGSGADLWAYLTPQKPTSPLNEDEGEDPISSYREMQDRWGRLTGAMAGLFCASLNFMDSTTTASPALSFPPLGHVSPRARLMRSSLAHESLCTENLTPFIKQLPCRDQAGIARLLSPHTILSSTFHVISIHVRRLCSHSEEDGNDEDEEMEEKCFSPYWEVTQLVTTVLKSGDDTGEQGSFDLSTSFGEVLPLDSCPVALDSTIQAIDAQGNDHMLSLVDTDSSEAQEGWNKVITLLSKGTNLSYSSSSFSSIRVNRRLAGTGQDGGKFVITITNTHPSESIPATYLDVIPWYLRPYLSTLTATINGTLAPEVIQAQRYQTARDRERPSIIELILQLPPSSILTLVLDVDRAMLKYSEHPPDANRGFDLPPAILTLHHRPGQVSSEDADGGPWRLYTSPLLVSLPTPDFSMPYNVITLTCTTVALFFGSMFNLLTRQLVPVKVPMSS
ncbi:GPI transamidase component PIG-T [Piptocephalis cylindrospora]|uniref:GPI transamidase component PIG-T n=1 Tax=Piptocephalis cylindrospora TaxID=1907219 RepID=A0A4P9Y8Z4_9FUNG|nr:GPI transamidase component PIG-T [Piptocephalis cylindrospora]|eukprot:RKP15294.1 GPI transamidase component PIG-T [Piptocephalis cylindrospora]